MTVKKTHWLRTSIAIMLAFAIVGLALTAFLFFKNPDPTFAKATLEFTFQGAADGVAPNGATFSVADIASEEIIAAALEENGLQDKYTVEQLQDNLVARGVYPDDIAAQVMSYESLLNFAANREATFTNYHPTTFDISLYSDFDKSISKSQLQSLLKSIMSAYKAYFAKVYANGLRKDDMLFTLEDYDYPQQLEILRSHYGTLAQYAEDMYQRSPSFLLDGAGFNDIALRMNTLISSDIARLSADLTMNALSRDAVRLETQYRFEIHDLNNRLGEQQALLKKLDGLIDRYEKNGIIYVSSGETLSRIDSNTSVTYDTLVDQRKQVADGITQINAQIAAYELKLSDLPTARAAALEEEAAEADTGDSAADAEEEAEDSDDLLDEVVSSEPLTQAQADALQRSINALAEKGDAITDDFQVLLDAYNAQQINDLTVTVTRYGYDAPTVLSGAFAKKAIKTAGPVCAIGFMLCMVLIIHSRRKEERRK